MLRHVGTPWLAEVEAVCKYATADTEARKPREQKDSKSTSSVVLTNCFKSQGDSEDLDGSRFNT
ncbi:hypothetical protein AOL_s00176g94 [Orbilia oligospora ATCC 24927]|uniref:Uncharacterized protein n=2 Tax=Orbilia oligospora TaxID=2813651 RepID=G1XPW9_ARTOA|nr:hypothetical protein AOL_s00176g94 [Orbilia oligospora ATCC 24927]EGX44812.1 hypothetical protein AOL_s00176g94 [Orbilia oligospora ATCC 24927]